MCCISTAQGLVGAKLMPLRIAKAGWHDHEVLRPTFSKDTSKGCSRCTLRTPLNLISHLQLVWSVCPSNRLTLSPVLSLFTASSPAENRPQFYQKAVFQRCWQRYSTLSPLRKSQLSPLRKSQALGSCSCDCYNHLKD